jgi:hypothetical protein
VAAGSAPRRAATSADSRMISRRVLLIAGIAVAALASTLVDPSAGAPSRIIDRTFRCATAALGGGLRDLDVTANPPLHDPYFNYRSPAYIGVSSGPDTLDADLVYVRARAGQPYGGRTFPPGVYANARTCSPARSPVPLSPKGLPGPPVQWRKQTQCRLRGRILVRVRAVLESAASWLPTGELYGGARMNVIEAALAVRTEPGRRPVVLIQVGRSGKTKLWTGPSCE